MTGIVTRENPIRRATCDPAGAGFDRIVEIRPDPDSRIGYPSIPNRNWFFGFLGIDCTLCNAILHYVRCDWNLWLLFVPHCILLAFIPMYPNAR